jgi:D-amino-acid dehydrogenase
MHIHIIGAGVIGLTTAYYLCEKGHKVTIIEQESNVALGASFANGGQLSYCFSDPLGKPSLLPKLPGIALNRDLAIRFNIPSSYESLRWLMRFAANCTEKNHGKNQLQLAKLSLSSMSLLAKMRDHLNLTFDHQKSSKLALFEKKKDFINEMKSLSLKQSLGNDNKAISIQEAESLEPAISNLTKQYAGAIYSESDEVGDTLLFCKELKDWLIKNGTDFHFETQVIELMKKNSKCYGINTNKGFFETENVIVCAGSLTEKIVQSPSPITSARGYSLTLPKGSVDLDVSLTLSDQRVLFTKLGEKIRVTGFADLFCKEVDDDKRIQELMDIAQDVAPELADYDSSKIDSWSGDRPLTPSSIPFIGPSKTEGVFINSGHGFYGWTLSFASGKIISNYF